MTENYGHDGALEENDGAEGRLAVQSMRNRLASKVNQHLSRLNATPVESFVEWVSDETYVCRVSGAEARFIVSSATEFRRYDTLVGEQLVLERLLKSIEPDDVVYDVGANTGLYSCLVGDALQGGHVVAFEPHPVNADRLNENAALNGLDIKLMRVALSDENDTGKLAVRGEDVGAGHHRLVTADDEKQTVSVDVRTGDNIVERGVAELPDVMKIDVEGEELAVLRGFTEGLQTCRVVLCECHGASKVDAARHHLESAGYGVESLGSRDNAMFLFAKRRGSEKP